LGDPRHGAAVPLLWVGLVASCVCGVMVAGSAVLVGVCVRCVVRPAKM
jgi:hypothetical protein